MSALSASFVAFASYVISKTSQSVLSSALFIAFTCVAVMVAPLIAEVKLSAVASSGTSTAILLQTAVSSSNVGVTSAGVMLFLIRRKPLSITVCRQQSHSLCNQF